MMTVRPPVPALSVLVLVASLLAASAGAQTLPDLQPGRNFTSAVNFGANRSANITPGDVDNDGDMDVVVANGDGSVPQPNRIFINLGGLQGGSLASFAEETATRFAGFPVNSARDIDFVDFENDGDLDAFVTNVNQPVPSGNTPCRFYTNKGGVQAGTVGFYQEETNLRWGQLASISPMDQILGGNQGPFRGYTCDCNFADLDDDGDSDLFYGSYGPGINGTRDSLLFLNDGNGIFDEVYPWANPAADIKTHTIGFDLVDLDGDFDIDIAMSSRNSAARTYMNNTVNGIGPARFNDITQTALFATGATGSATVNYEVESGDLDGDGDFDLWMDGYDGNTDRILRNNGFVPGVGYSFTEMAAWIKGNPNVDEQNEAFTDYDGDGDLDVFNASFTGTNYLFQNVLAQGLAFDTLGLVHRTGTTANGSLSPVPELPATLNTGNSEDGDTADLDNDGDEELLVANAGNNPDNFLYTNVLGVPDTHAPTFYKLTQQGDKPNGSETVVHAQIRDNSSRALTLYYTATLVYSVDGGPEVNAPMFPQASMQYRGVIPAQTDAWIAWRVEVSDLAGNPGVSSTQSFAQGSPATPWTELGFGLAGVAGVPHLSGTGSLLGGQALTLSLTSAAPNATVLLFLALGSSPVPFKGGQLAAFPWLAGFPIALVSGPGGTLTLPAVLPAGANGLGVQLHFQEAVADAAAVQGVALSNLLRGAVP